MSSSGGGGEVEQLGKWVVGDMLGEGGFSQVRLGTHSKNGKVAALKILEKKGGDSVNSSERKQVESEIDAMQKIDHPNVIRMIDFNLDMVFRKKNIILVVLELASGGELFEYLSFTGAFEEPIARSYFHQLMEGLQAAHSKGICHRDLKPENLLMDDNFMLKIADFGFAHTMKSSSLYTECGTRGYMAPEMFRTKTTGYNGALTDVWACGVILFIMVAGFPPYQQPTKQDWWFHKLLSKKYDRFWMAHCRTAYFSEDAKDLINKIFTADPASRISVDDIMKHPWYQGEILESTHLTKVLAARKLTVDIENNKLKVQKAQQQTMEGYGAGTARGVGDQGTEEDAASDDLPDGAPPSIIVALQTGEEMKDEGSDQEGEDEVAGGAFDLQDTETKKKGDAPTYKPIKMNFTKFNASLSPEETYNELLSVFKSLKLELEEEEGYSIKVTVKDVKGNFNFVANVFANDQEKDVEEKTMSIVECQRRKGDSIQYRNFYAQIRNKMDEFATKPVKDSTTEDVKTDDVKATVEDSKDDDTKVVEPESKDGTETVGS